VTHAFNQTDDIFYMNRRLISETISAPTLKALKETSACNLTLEK